MKYALLLLFIAACSTPSDPVDMQAQQTRERLEASEGGRLVLRAIEAHGGLEAWYGAPTSSYFWEYANTGSNTRFKSFLVADNATRLVYHDLVELGTPDSVETIQAQFGWNGSEAWIYPPELEQPNPMFWASTGYYFESIPFVLADPGLRYDVLPPDTLDGVPYDMVKASFDVGVGMSDGDTYTLYVDQQSGRVRAIRYTVTFGRGRPAPDQAPSENLFYYDDYVTVDGLTVATYFHGYSYRDGVKGAPRNEAWASDISFRRPFDAARLVPPEGARIIRP